MSDRRPRMAALLLTALGALLGWWAWKQGAYFGSVFYPGAMLAWLLLAMVLTITPLRLRLGGPARAAAVALAAPGGWTLLSALWSSVPAAALSYAAHDLLYLAIFGLGVAITNLLGARMWVALAAVALVGAAIAIATVVVLAVGHDVTWYLQEDATLRFPIGYRNAAAAFFLICLWPLAALAAAGPRWQLRAVLLACGTVLFELAVLAQSRGSIPAATLALVVYLALSRRRLRAAAVLALIVLPALPAFPALLDVFRHGSADPAVIPSLRAAARAIGLTGLLSLAVGGAAFGLLEPRLRLGARATARLGRLATAVAVTAVAVSCVVVVTHHGGPVGFVNQRVRQFTSIGYPNLSGQGVRYGVNVGSNRYDFWRVAADEGLDRPLLGGGAGSFQVEYLRHRRSEETPEDPHSVEALMFSELGFPGFLLLLAFLCTAVVAGLRSRRLGPNAAILVAGAFAAGTQWLTHASYDWLWNYPGVTAPAIFLLGAAAAPALFDPRPPADRRPRAAGAAVLLVLAVLAIPLFFAARYLRGGLGAAGADPAAAVADLRRAADLDPLDAEPLLLEATVEAGRGGSARAVALARQALGREPDNFGAHLLIARELARADPPAARRELEAARALNPTDPGVRALGRRLAMPAR